MAGDGGGCPAHPGRSRSVVLASQASNYRSQSYGPSWSTQHPAIVCWTQSSPVHLSMDERPLRRTSCYTDWDNGGRKPWSFIRTTSAVLFGPLDGYDGCPQLHENGRRMLFARVHRLSRRRWHGFKYVILKLTSVWINCEKCFNWWPQLIRGNWRDRDRRTRATVTNVTSSLQCVS